jgi:tRNA 2-thiouridine synthesizing protein A
MSDSSLPIEVDARGLACPLPLLKAKQALNKLEAGQLLRVFTTDPGSVRDFKVFATQSGHLLEEFIERPESFEFLLRKS